MRQLALKKAYLMYNNGMPLPQITREIKRRYGYSFKNSDYVQLFGLRKRKSDFSKKDHSLIKAFYENCRDTNKILEYLNPRISKPLTVANLQMLANRNGYSKKVRKKNANAFLSFNKEKALIADYYLGLSCNELAHKYGFKTAKSVADILKKEGIDVWSTYIDRVHSSVPHRHFSMKQINTPFKAYFLGLMATDGWVNEQRKSVSISLIDEDCISFLSENIGCSYATFNKKKENHLPFHKIEMRNASLYDELVQHGVTPQKSKTLSIKNENIPDELYPYFIRGTLDGDGWIRKDGREFFICSASQVFLSSMIPFLENQGMISLKVKKGSNGVYVLRSGIRHNMNILSTFYAEPFGMARKRNLLVAE